APIVEQEAPPDPQIRIDTTAIRNAARVTAMKHAIASGLATEVDRVIDQSEREIVAGVNVCPPVDFKPDSADGYCVRCEGFAECSVRYLRANRPQPVAPPFMAGADVPL